MFVKDGDFIEIPCIDIRGMVGITLSWRRNNQTIPISMIQPNGSLILEDVVESRDTGYYDCDIDIGKRRKTLETDVKAILRTESSYVEYEDEAYPKPTFYRQRPQCNDDKSWCRFGDCSLENVKQNCRKTCNIC